MNDILTPFRKLKEFIKARGKKTPLGGLEYHKDGSVWEKIAMTGKKKHDWKMVKAPTNKQRKKSTTKSPKKAKVKAKEVSHGAIKPRNPNRPQKVAAELPGSKPVGTGEADGGFDRNGRSGQEGGDEGASAIVRGDSRIRSGVNLRDNLTPAQQKKVNTEILELMARKGPTGDYTPEEKAKLRLWTGAGAALVEDYKAAGIDPMSRISAMFTPDKIIESIWKLTNKYIGKNGRVMEPSAGIGRFADHAGSHKVDMLEIDKITATINRVIHPESTVLNAPFEELFIDKGPPMRPKPYTGPKYDAVVGNPPYNKFLSAYAGIIPKGEKPDTYYEYFINKGLDMLREGGVLSMIVPSSFLRAVNTPNRAKIRDLIAGKAKLMEAYRMPTEGVFYGADIGTDIIVLRKDAEGMDSSVLAEDTYFKGHHDHICANQLTDPATGHYFLPGTKTPDLEKKPLLDRYRKPYPGGYLGLPEGGIDASLAQMENESKKIQPPPDPQKENQIASNSVYGLLDGVKTDSQSLSEAMLGNQNAAGPHKTSKKADVKEKEDAKFKKEKVEAGVFTMDEWNKKYNLNFTKQDQNIWKATNADSSVNLEKCQFDPERMSYMDGKYYHDVQYASGNIYDKLAATEAQKDTIIEKHGREQYEKQTKILKEAIPHPKTIKQMTISPLSPLAESLSFQDGDSLVKKFYDWAGVRSHGYDRFKGAVSEYDLQSAGVSWSDIEGYISREVVRADRSDNPEEKSRNQSKAEETRRKRREWAEKFFKRFLNEGLHGEDRKVVENAYNQRFNGYAHLDYTKVPNFIEGVSKTFKKDDEGNPIPFEIRDIQLQGLGFLAQKGSGIVAYDVGVGKTAVGILGAVQSLQRGWCKRPVICVPKNVSSKWVKEIREMLPNVKVNDFGNFSEFKGGKPEIEDGSISVITYEGLERLKINEDKLWDIVQDFKDSSVLDIPAGTGKKSDEVADAEAIQRAKAKLMEVLFKEGIWDFDELGFDHITIDEAHNFKNVFGRAKVSPNASAKDRKEERKKQQANEFSKLVGGESDRAARAFVFSRYIQRNNGDRNVTLLTATPFTNSPIEIYNMLSMVASSRLKELGIDNMNSFLSSFAEIKTEWGVKGNNEIQKIDVVKKFNNLSALQSLIREFIDFRTGDDIPEIKKARPKLNQFFMKEPPILKANETQEALRKQEEERYNFSKEDGAKLVAINNQRMSNISPKMVVSSKLAAGQAIDEAGAGVTSLKVVSTGEPLNFVQDSPKLEFTTKLVGKMINKMPNVGHVIYLPFGTDHYEEIVDSLVKDQGLSRDQIGFIHAGVSKTKQDKLKENFNNPSNPLKVMLGSRTILEGVDLNGNTAFLHNLCLDWNPSSTRQFLGRGWRQGNRQKEVFAITPLIGDTIDSGMYQKHDEKMARFGEIWSYKGAGGEEDSMSVEDISPESLKYDLIRDPVKRAEMRIREEREQFQDKRNETLRRSEEWAQFAKNFETNQHGMNMARANVKEYQEQVEGYKAKVKDAPETNERGYYQSKEYFEEQLERARSYRDAHQKSARDYEKKNEQMEERMGSIGLTLDGIPDYVKRLETEADQLEEQVKAIDEKKPAYIDQEIDSESKRPKALGVDAAVSKYEKYIIDQMAKNASVDTPEQMQKSTMWLILSRASALDEPLRVEFIKSHASRIEIGSVRGELVRKAFARKIVPMKDLGLMEKLFAGDADVSREITRAKQYAST